MQLLTLAAAAALSATASAYTGVKSNYYNSTCQADKPRARIVNNCPYSVYAWTVDSDDNGYDCKFHDGLELAPGAFYWENFRPASTGAISIKLGKNERCEEDGSIVQLEYNIVPPEGNFLDVSYVNCQKKDCPTADEGWRLLSGNSNGKFKTAGADNSICPDITCSNIADCAKYAYIMPDDIATKNCAKDANLDFYMCGADSAAAPSSHSEVAAAPSKSKTHEKPSEKAPAPTSATYEDVAAADVEAPAVTAAPQGPKVVKTEIVYKTVHVNAHRRRHHGFHA